MSVPLFAVGRIAASALSAATRLAVLHGRACGCLRAGIAAIAAATPGSRGHGVHLAALAGRGDGFVCGGHERDLGPVVGPVISHSPGVTPARFLRQRLTCRAL